MERLVDVAEVIAAVTPVPLKVTAVAPEKFCPEIVAATVAPGAAEDGEIEVTTGGVPGKAAREKAGSTRAKIQKKTTLTNRHFPDCVDGER